MTGYPRRSPIWRLLLTIFGRGLSQGNHWWGRRLGGDTSFNLSLFHSESYLPLEVNFRLFYTAFNIWCRILGPLRSCFIFLSCRRIFA